MIRRISSVIMRLALCAVLLLAAGKGMADLPEELYEDLDILELYELMKADLLYLGEISIVITSKIKRTFF